MVGVAVCVEVRRGESLKPRWSGVRGRKNRPVTAQSGGASGCRPSHMYSPEAVCVCACCKQGVASPLQEASQWHVPLDLACTLQPADM